MTESTPTAQPILIIGDEEVFAAFLQHFPASRYILLFAAGAAEAMALCESRSPRLMVVPLARGGTNLAAALRAVDHAGGKILGLYGPGEAGTTPEGVDRAVPHDDPDDIIEAARDLLQERRQQPRVIVEFPVRFGANRQGLARDLSNRSLVIETTERLKVKERLPLELHWGNDPQTITTTVDRVTPLDMGRYSALLLLDPDDQAAQDYLDEVIRKILEVEHYLWALEPGRPSVRGPAAWNLARRAEQSLLRTAELGLSPEAPEAAPQAPAPAPTADTLDKRYALGTSRGRWGVGEVREAEHRLLKRPVLVKQLAAELREDATARQRLEAEARAASAVSNDCIADVLDFGDDGEAGLFYTLERLDGETLAAALGARSPFFVTDISRLGVHVSFALAAAHKQGVFHWDLCPEHVFLHRAAGGMATPKLVAFAGAPDAPREPPAHPVGLAFRPPGEAAKTPSAAWDAFALCRMLSRIQPADGSSEQAVRLRSLLGRGAASDPSRHFEDMSQLCRALYRLLRDTERDSSADLGTRIVPAVLPDDFGAFRTSSTGLQAVLDPPLAMPWPRSTVALTPPPVGPTAPAPEPPRLTPPPGSSDDPFDDVPTSVADLQGLVTATRATTTGTPAIAKAAAAAPAVEAPAPQVPAPMEDDDAPTRVADDAGAADFATPRNHEDAPTHVADAHPAPAPQGPPPAAREKPATTGRPAGPAPKKTLYGVPAAQLQPDAPVPGAVGAPGAPSPGRAAGAPGGPAMPRPGGPAPTPRTPAAEPSSELEPAFGKLQDDEFDEAPTNVVTLETMADKKTLFGVPAAQVIKPPPGAKAPAKRAPGGPTPPAAVGPAPAKGAPDKKTLFGVPAASLRPVAPGPTTGPLPGPAGPPPAAGPFPEPGAPPRPGPPAGAPPPGLAATPVLPPAAAPGDLIASAIAEQLTEGAAQTPAATQALEAAEPLPEGQAPLLEPSLTGAPTAAASPTPAPEVTARGKRLVILLVVGLLVLGGGGAALWFGVLAKGDGADKPSGALADKGPGMRPRPDPRRLAPRRATSPDAGVPARAPAKIADAGAPAPDAAAPAATPDAAAPAATPDAAITMTKAQLREHRRLLREKKKAEAKKRLKERLAHIDKGRALMRQKRWNESRHFLTEALKMWDSPRLRMLFSLTYSEVGQTWPAIHHQKKAVALSPGSVSHQLRLGQLYLKVGKRSMACAAFRAARAAKPDHAQAKKLTKRFCGG